MRKSRNTRYSNLKVSGLLLMTIAWLLLNTMYPVMASSHPAGSATMQTMEEFDPFNHFGHSAQVTHKQHAEPTDIPSAPSDSMKDCVSFSCCLITREEPVLLQAWRHLSTLNFDKSGQAIFVDFKPGSKDRPPKDL